MPKKGLPGWAIKRARALGAKGRGMFKKAWALYRGKRAKSSATSTPTKTTTTRTTRKVKTRRMDSTTKKHRSRGTSIVRTAYKLIPVAALAAPGVLIAMDPAIPSDRKMAYILAKYTGYADWKEGGAGFVWTELAAGWTPFIVSLLVTKGAQKLSGIIRSL